MHALNYLKIYSKVGQKKKINNIIIIIDVKITINFCYYVYIHKKGKIKKLLCQ